MTQTAALEAPPTIPLVDIEPLRRPADPAATRAAGQLCRAYEEVGFAYIVGHGVPQAAVDRAFAASAEFHASPMEQKRSIAINEFHRGYMALATSTVVTSTVAQNRKPNLSESLMLMHEVASDDPDRGQPLQGPNQWPEWLPHFRPVVEAYIAELGSVARRLLGAFTLGLGLPPDYLEPLFAKPTTFLRLLHYPPHPPDAPDGQFGSAPHTDYGCMTILAQDKSGGL